MTSAIERCDIFCSVIDNFGDIGICWRLSRQLVAEHQLDITLWVDDLHSFARICPQVQPDNTSQRIEGVLVRYWSSPLPELEAKEYPQLVIEALACTIPTAYLQALAQHQPQALWLNLEYLSAEDWVHGCHGLASPQQGLALHKYFFFPGFTGQTGALLRERNLVATLDAFATDTKAQQQFWLQLGLSHVPEFDIKVSLFAYDQPAIGSWLEQLSQAHTSTVLLVPEGVLANRLKTLWPELSSQSYAQRGNLRIDILPFMPQQQYDYLLAACDINFVRGEDSVIRAHWAGKTFIWQIYRQHEQAHQVKLDAFLTKYLQQAPAPLQQLLLEVHRRWDLELPLAELWPLLLENKQEIALYNKAWRAFLMTHEDLASNLVRFAENKCKMPRNFS
ncbi:elongation factor P maturation arginine rhamnosyltransferase EarP [Rheinheimera sp. 4Y26]|uniref:elongation factor P maturation arginine rhamnosyltransferase EarP n=1 Tax=Rheinheimera sp. 4Y26 TaxID=2977811 RepID=UPI0021B1374E|nr:elongation factor P maturation arginine rhamnosyltransferase EarP [Rheinheimera sp. 4Y26]MCT6699744.1 elongation factor P maturation arginine rhamnosyltransferase EarP [Rheinheimera sp. 4Y26]